MSFLSSAKRVVIKVGSALVTDQQAGAIRTQWLDSLVEDVLFLLAQEKEVLIVTSGAVALGKTPLNLKRKPLLLSEKQAAAACGQIALVSAYQQSFSRAERHVAQILLTIDDSEDRKRYLNARQTLQTLLKLHAVPIINENDSVATAELRVGDNDRLAARVAQMVDADWLILLSDIDGLYTGNPHVDNSATWIPEVSEITPDIEEMAGGSSSQVGTGGMVTKIAAAKIAQQSGCHMVITQGKSLHPLKTWWEGGRGTLFHATSTPLSSRKQWIAARLYPKGTIVINHNAVLALQNGKSLLSVGVLSVQGDFDRGDPVFIEDETGHQIAKGLIAFTSEEAERIIGCHSKEIAARLGYACQDELIHRDDLVVGENFTFAGRK